MTEPYYQDDLVTLYHGDCREITEWLAADVLVTDPPYGMRAAARGTYDTQTGVTHKPHGAERIAGDETVDVRDDALSVWGDRPAIVFGTWRQPRPVNVAHRLIWWKRGAAPGPARCSFMLQDEEIYVIGGGGANRRRRCGASLRLTSSARSRWLISDIRRRSLSR